MPNFEASSTFPCERATLFDYHRAHGAIDRLIPPWERVTVLASQDSLEVGSKVVLENTLFGIRQTWQASHVELDPGRLFVDRIEQGPFRSWLHRHEFEDISHNKSRLTDRIAFELPLAPASNIALGWVQQQLHAMFRYRHRITADDIAAQIRLMPFFPLSARPRIAITGSSGLIGQRTLELASVLGMDVIRIVRSQTLARRQRDPENVRSAQLDLRSAQDRHALEGLDAVIHLGGAGIGDRRWSARVKQSLRDSRVQSTQRMVDFFKQLDRPPKALVSASGIGIFGDRGEEICREDSKPGLSDDFLVSVAKDWEAASQEFGMLGRVAIARLGVVLHPRAGALPKLLTPTRLGVGGPIGSGRQYWPWVHVDDAANILLHLAFHPTCSGPFHVVSPEMSTNRQFTQSLAEILHRPAFLPAPAWAMKLLLGEMAGPLLLSSTKATTERLLASGYQFRFSNLSSAFANLLGREDPAPS